MSAPGYEKQSTGLILNFEVIYCYLWTKFKKKKEKEKKNRCNRTKDSSFHSTHSSSFSKPSASITRHAI